MYPIGWTYLKVHSLKSDRFSFIAPLSLTISNAHAAHDKAKC